jgi:hypothetical protein
MTSVGVRSHNGIVIDELVEPLRFFVIGFNKTGTTSIDAFFQSYGFKTMHWKSGDRYLARQIEVNLRESEFILRGINDFDVYSDFTFVSDYEAIEGNQYFRQIHSAFPNAYFILNTRSLQGWILSRLRHPDFAERYSKALNCSIFDLITFWKELKVSRELEIRQYFAGSDRFAEFDIDREGFRELAKKLGFTMPVLKDSEFHLNRSARPR